MDIKSNLTTNLHRILRNQLQNIMLLLKLIFVLQAHQLETILWALDDFSIMVREKLHEMLQASNIATKDGLQNVIGKLLENLNLLEYSMVSKHTSVCFFKINRGGIFVTLFKIILLQKFFV